MMARTQFEELRVYVMAEQLADCVWDVVTPWDMHAKLTVGQQLVRAADSVGANIAEGAGLGSFANNRRHVRIARGSLNETRHWLRRAYCRKLLSEVDVSKLQPLIENLAPMLNAYLKSIGKRKPTRQ
jgi:four helix bundle protein